MRSCAILLRTLYSAPTLLRASPVLLATAAAGTTGAGRNGGNTSKKKGTSKQPKTKKAARDANLATFMPSVASTWMTAASNKMLQPQHVAPDSRKLVWWCCPSCQHQFTKRIDLHVAAGGECPKCHAKPSLTATAGSTSGCGKAKGDDGTDAVKVLAYKSRPDSSLSTLEAENANRIKKSVADGSYLRRQETRNLMPMLAKNYDKEGAKIGADEVVAVSPKLDGIRCVTAYDQKSGKILFFSRAGTLFECCDAKIEPYLHVLFEADPTLVLDGELYNDSANLHKMAELLSSPKAGKTASAAGGDVNTAMLSILSERTARANPYLPATCFAMSDAVARTRKHGGKGSSSGAMGGGAKATQKADEEEVVSFDQLTSAIRTTREHRTAQHEALQRKLQYHIFDVLYCRHFPRESDSQPFRVRFDYLVRLLATAHEKNLKQGSQNKFLSACSSPYALPYDARVLRVVPSIFCTKQHVDSLLRAAMVVGYEGVMIRRDGLKQADGLLTFASHHNNNDDRAAADSTRKKTQTSRASAEDIKQELDAVQVLVHDSLTGGVRAGGKGGKQTATKHAGGYGYGQRSSTLLKYKVMQDAEFVIVSAVEGKGKWKGCLGAFVCQTPDTKRRFTVTPATTDAQKRKIWQTWQRDYKGKALTVQYQELTADGIPRFPIGKAIRGAANGQDWI